jgi:hypothetical protein
MQRPKHVADLLLLIGDWILLIGDWIFRGIGSGRGLLIGDWILLIGDWIFRGIGSGSSRRHHHPAENVPAVELRTLAKATRSVVARMRSNGAGFRVKCESEGLKENTRRVHRLTPKPDPVRLTRSEAK